MIASACCWLIVPSATRSLSTLSRALSPRTLGSTPVVEGAPAEGATEAAGFAAGPLAGVFCARTTLVPATSRVAPRQRASSLRIEVSEDDGGRRPARWWWRLRGVQGTGCEPAGRWRPAGRDLLGGSTGPAKDPRSAEDDSGPQERPSHQTLEQPCGPPPHPILSPSRARPPPPA